MAPGYSVVFLGPEQSGKSRLISELTGTASEQHAYQPTIGQSYVELKRENQPSIHVNELGGTGFPRYRTLFESSAASADMVYLTVNLNSDKSIEDELKPYVELLQHKDEPKEKKPLVIVGCGISLLNQKTLEAKKIALDTYLETTQGRKLSSQYSVSTGIDANFANEFSNAVNALPKKMAEQITTEEILKDQHRKVTQVNVEVVENADPSLLQLNQEILQYPFRILFKGKEVQGSDNKPKKMPAHALAMLNAKSADEIQRLAWVASNAFSLGRNQSTRCFYKQIINGDFPGLNKIFVPRFYVDNQDTPLNQFKQKILDDMKVRVGGTKIAVNYNGQEKTIRVPAHMAGILLSENLEEAQNFAKLGLENRAPGRTSAHKEFYKLVVKGEPLQNENDNAPPVSPT